MPALVILSPAPGAGKTTVATLIAGKLHLQGHPVSLSRLGDDDHAAADSALFSRLQGGGEVEIVEGPAGDSAAGAPARALIVADAATPTDELTGFARRSGERVAGVVLNRVPAKRRERVLAAAATAGIKVVLDLPEDRLLATPSLGDVAMALDAQTLFFDSQGGRSLDRALIAPISADPGQGYFAVNEANAVIVRSDKPDLQLAALNAGASCLIVTGELPLLGYVTERAEADEIPVIRTRLDTVETVKSIEGLFGSVPFSGSPAKLSRLAELTQGFDASSLLGA